MCYQFFRKESALFTPKNTLLERVLTTSLANYEEDSLDVILLSANQDLTPMLCKQYLSHKLFNGKFLFWVLSMFLELIVN